MMELRRRYQSLYIPSDFFDAVFTWVDAFPMTRPFQLNNTCNFHILHKEVDPLVKNTAVLDPPDANHTYSAKVRAFTLLEHFADKLNTDSWFSFIIDIFVLQVMLLANPSIEELYHKSCALAEDTQEVRDSFQHPARLIKVYLISSVFYLFILF